MKSRPAYAWLLEGGVIDHRHEQTILRFHRMKKASKPPLCHVDRVLSRQLGFGAMFDLSQKMRPVAPGYSLDFLWSVYSDLETAARLRQTCATVMDTIRRFETPAPLVVEI